MDLDYTEKARKEMQESDEIRDAGLTTPKHIVRYDNICYGKDAIWNVLDVYHPEGVSAPGPAIVSVHGGGWVYGDKERYQYYCMSLAERGFTVVNFTYRLAPAHIFPAALEDVNSVFVWIAEHGREYQIDPDCLFVVGDSAGGQLASQYLALLSNASYRRLFDFVVPHNRVTVRGAALNCGVYDMKTYVMETDGKEDLFLAYLHHEADRYLAQIDTVSYITEAYPPSFIMTSHHDFLSAHAEPMYRLLQEKGVPCRYRVYGGTDRPDIDHVFHLNVRLPEAKACNDDECAFFREILEAKSAPVPTPHNGAGEGEIAKTVLMPGDPLRAKYIAETYLEDAVCFNTVRNMLGYTGTYQGKRISVMGGGMGIPSIGIYSYELYHFYGVESIIRIGSAGGYADELEVMDIVIGMGACTNSNYAQQYGLPGTFAPIADYELLQKAVDVAARQGKKVRVGNILSSDVFYADDPTAADRWKQMGVLAVEMEAAALYMNAARAGKKALCILTISDHLYKPQELTAEQRQTGFGSMMEIALEL